MGTDGRHHVKHVVVLGMNHASSSGELRDRLLFPDTGLEKGLEAIRDVQELCESMILSTCNRVELYGVSTNPGSAREALLNFMAQYHGIEVEEFSHSTYFYHCDKAVEHLHSVAASLDSMVVGETQILGQVKDAYMAAARAGNTSTYLNKLCHFAIEAGKRVMTDTRINAGLVSISSVAVELAKKILGRLGNSVALVIGAGEMSMLAAQHFSSAGIGKMYFANRTRERAMEMAAEFNGTPLVLSEWPEVLDQCDVVVSSTGSPHYVVKPEHIKSAMARRKNQPVFLIDIAAPRDIDPAVAELYNVFVYSIDDLARVVHSNTNARAEEIGNARRVLGEEITKYFDWYNSLKVTPTLVKLRRKFEDMCAEELKRYENSIASLPEDARKVVRQFASSLTKKFLRVPSRVLHEKTQKEDAAQFADTVADLFDLKAQKDDE